MHPRPWLRRLAASLALTLIFPLLAQNLLPNPGFEEGTDQPVGWRLADGKGDWGMAAPDGNRAVRVQGNGDDQSVWRTEPLKLQPGGLYSLRFHARRAAGASGGTAVAGPSRVNRDFPLDSGWQPYRFVFSLPDHADGDFVRLGQWHVQGGLEFDTAELVPVLAVHQSVRNVRLGEGESIEQGVYRFRPQYEWAGSDYHRPLFRNRAAFNSGRWVFSPGAEIVYRFLLPDQAQSHGRVRINLNHYVAGALEVRASRDATNWMAVATFDGQNRAGTANLPAALFPAAEVFIRLAAAGGDAEFQVNACDYEAGLNPPPADAVGATHFVEVLHRSPDLSVDWRCVDTRVGQSQVRGWFYVTNTSAQPLTLTVLVTNENRRITPSHFGAATLEAGRSTTFCPIVQLERPGKYPLIWSFSDRTGRLLFAARSETTLSFLYDGRPGHWLAETNDVAVWWCESGWKIGRSAQPPPKPAAGSAPSLTIAAARGEFEAAQLLVRASAEHDQLLAAGATPFRNRAGAATAISVRFDTVAYVPVHHPTDDTCERDEYPDPLPPLQAPISLQDGRNHPLWLTFYVPRETEPGDYASQVELKLGSGTIRVPLAVHVYDFEMPRATHLHSALGLGTGEINRYHRLTRPADQRAVFEQYLQNFAEHRISPYTFYDYASIDVRFVGEGTNRQAQLDFTAFDAAAQQWLGGKGPSPGSASRPGGSPFNTFQLILRGMGGGTFHERHLGELAGFKEGTPEHTRLFKDYLGQIERHLRERGWLEKAFTYWFDEPDPKDYDFVVAGMKRLRDAAPGIKRMLTEQPEAALMGNVEIWCGLTPEWTPERVRARRDAGEQVWWYICCAPKAPYVTEFIDHPGTELRLWPWQSWQYGVTGILIWATIYWNSPCAYPAPQLQDPWQDPMSWVSGYSTPVGTRNPWGNGDGRFLYPPRRDPNTATEPCFDTPINSIRWENLRDGMEDYEYFWLLEQEVNRLTKSSGETALVKEARGLLRVPETVSRDLTHFTTDPRPILEHREKIAGMIERLRRAQ